MPDVTKYARVEVNNLSNVPSDYMDPPRWMALTRAVEAALARPEVAGVIISHGTDTLEETAWWLDLTVDSPKPIVLVGAQRIASEPDFDDRATSSMRCESPWISPRPAWARCW